MADRKVKPSRSDAKKEPVDARPEPTRVTVAGDEVDPAVTSFNEQLLEDARKKGRAARDAGRQPEDCPYAEDYPGRGFRVAWVEGWYERAREIAAAKAKVVPVVQEVPVTTAGTFWPKGKPLPTHYKKLDPMPCPNCRAHLLPTSSQAVLVKYMKETIASLQCRACGHEFRLPIVRV